MNISQDSKRFEGIDIDFKELAYDAHKTPNVVEATNKPGLYNRLEDIQNRSIACFFMSSFFSLAHIFTAQQYGSECTVTINIIYNPQAAFQSSMKSTSYKHTLSACCFFPAGWLSVKRLWLNIWISSGWLSPGSTSSRLLICWTSCPMAPTLSRLHPFSHKCMPFMCIDFSMLIY